MSELKDAILRRRGVASPYQAKDPLDAVVERVIERVINERLQSMLEQIGPAIHTYINDTLDARFAEFKGAPGKDGVDAEFNIDEVAAHAAKLIPPIDTAEICEQITNMLPSPVLDHEVIAGHVAKLLPPPLDPFELEKHFLEKIPTLPELEPQIILDKIHSVPGGIKMGAIDGLQTYLNNLNRAIREASRSSGGKMEHGGGMTLVAGSNITLVRNNNGTWSISSSGGSGFTTLTATETPSIAVPVFVFTFPAATAKPSFIIVDNVWQRDTTKAGGVNWTWNVGAKQATFTSAPQDDILGVV